MYATKKLFLSLSIFGILCVREDTGHNMKTHVRWPPERWSSQRKSKMWSKWDNINKRLLLAFFSSSGVWVFPRRATGESHLLTHWECVRVRSKDAPSATYVQSHGGEADVRDTRQPTASSASSATIKAVLTFPFYLTYLPKSSSPSNKKDNMPHKGECLCGQTTIELATTHENQVCDALACLILSVLIIYHTDRVPLYGLQTDERECI